MQLYINCSLENAICDKSRRIEIYLHIIFTIAETMYFPLNTGYANAVSIRTGICVTYDLQQTAHCSKELTMESGHATWASSQHEEIVRKLREAINHSGHCGICVF